MLAPYTFGGAGSDEIQTGVIETVEEMVIEPTAKSQTIAGGKYFANNIIINGISGLSAEVIKKDCIVAGVKGEWEGYVPGPADIYKIGANPFELYSHGSGNMLVTFETQQILFTGTTYVNGSGKIITRKPVNLAGYTQLIVVGKFSNTNTSHHWLYRDNYAVQIAEGIGTSTVAFNVSAFNAEMILAFHFAARTNDYIRQIYLV